jgi:hypothetical protein
VGVGSSNLLAPTIFHPEKNLRYHLGCDTIKQGVKNFFQHLARRTGRATIVAVTVIALGAALFSWYTQRNPQLDRTSSPPVGTVSTIEDVSSEQWRQSAVQASTALSQATEMGFHDLYASDEEYRRELEKRKSRIEQAQILWDEQVEQEGAPYSYINDKQGNPKSGSEVELAKMHEQIDISDSGRITLEVYLAMPEYSSRDRILPRYSDTRQNQEDEVKLRIDRILDNVRASGYDLDERHINIISYEYPAFYVDADEKLLGLLSSSALVRSITDTSQMEMTTGCIRQGSSLMCKRQLPAGTP